MTQVWGRMRGKVPSNRISGSPTTATTIKALAEDMGTRSDTNVRHGGPLTLNGLAVGQHDYAIKTGPLTLTQATADALFTDHEDTCSAWVVIKGDLTVPTGVTLKPRRRSLFTVVYVVGNLSVAGSISMSACGANHSGDIYSGGLITPVALAVTATVSIPALGGAGGASVRSDSAVGLAGASGSGVNGSGGGGSGGSRWNITYGGANGGSGSGAQGTCFSGGPGGGGTRAMDKALAHATTNGGRGGPGAGDSFNSHRMGSGSGNPSGFDNQWANTGQNGTGGTLVVIVTGTISGAGSLTATGTNGGNGSSSTETASGGGSGGGIIVALRTSGTLTTSVGGGIGGSVQYLGGNGGAGSARILAI